MTTVYEQGAPARAANITVSPASPMGREWARARAARLYTPEVCAALDEADRTADEQHARWQRLTGVVDPDVSRTVHESLIRAARGDVFAAAGLLPTQPPKES